MIPYPPVGVGVLASSVRHSTRHEANVVDLEILLNERWREGESCFLYQRPLLIDDVLAPTLMPEVLAFGEWMLSASGVADGTALGVSVMGFEQLSSALLLARLGLENDCRVILGGQFWTRESARDALRMLGAFGDAVITVGDGWRAICDFLDDARGVPSNSIASRGGEILEGERAPSGVPPQPEYSSVPWDRYEACGMKLYSLDRRIRRAHLYIWDKACHYRCAFCRVSSGSDSALVNPKVAVDSLEELVCEGATQFNLMTNELNPSLTYLRRFLGELERRILDPIDWFAYLRADRVDEVDMHRMRRAGGRLLRYGIETGSQRLLDLMRKDYRVDVMSDTLRFATDADIWNHINLLVGFPGEEDSDVDETCAFLEKHAGSIHSVRLNPFYLPPDTPMARSPGEFGITLTRFDRGWWDYRHVDGRDPDPSDIVRRTELIATTCVDLGIGFAGADPFFLLDVLARHETRSEAMSYLKESHRFFWDAAPTDAYKAKIGGYHSTATWEESIKRRGRNYSLTICTD